MIFNSPLTEYIHLLYVVLMFWMTTIYMFISKKDYILTNNQTPNIYYGYYSIPHLFIQNYIIHHILEICVMWEVMFKSPLYVYIIIYLFIVSSCNTSTTTYTDGFWLPKPIYINIKSVFIVNDGSYYNNILL